jgi:hypothetical protein
LRCCCLRNAELLRLCVCMYVRAALDRLHASLSSLSTSQRLAQAPPLHASPVGLNLPLGVSVLAVHGAEGHHHGHHQPEGHQGGHRDGALSPVTEDSASPQSPLHFDSSAGSPGFPPDSDSPRAARGPDAPVL